MRFAGDTRTEAIRCLKRRLARAAVIMTLEPVFAGVIAVGLGGELLTARS